MAMNIRYTPIDPYVKDTPIRYVCDRCGGDTTHYVCIYPEYCKGCDVCRPTPTVTAGITCMVKAAEIQYLCSICAKHITGSIKI